MSGGSGRLHIDFMPSRILHHNGWWILNDQFEVSSIKLAILVYVHRNGKITTR